jgi:hypothetical protein
LHGKILEDQELPAISQKYGEYQYVEILKRLGIDGAVVVSEKRAANTQEIEYAEKVSVQLRALLAANVPAKSISVVGASKGSYIAIYVSHLMKNSALNFVLLGSCHPSLVEQFNTAGITVYGNILAIRDYQDLDLSGSCDELAAHSKGVGLGRYQELVLRIGTGHGILYEPLDEWLGPTIRW